MTGNRVFFIGEWQVSPAEGVLVHGEDTVHLEPKAMEVLVYFASRPGEVITREDLERDVWRGALVGYDAITNTVIKLRKALGDDARKPRFITTIPKKGYQLIVPVDRTGQSEPTLSEVRTEGVSQLESVAPVVTSRTQQYRLLTIGAVVVLLVVAGWVYGTGNSTATREGIPSIAVLPFENLNASAKQDYLADGMTEDIITDLSKLSNILVIASSSTSAYKDKQDSVTEIGKELGVSYVVKGNVRRLGDNFRVNVQLVNAATGFNAWATRYDRQVNDLFNIQDDVSQNIVRALSVKVSNQEESRLARRSTNSLKAYDYFQEGMRNYRFITKETNELARQAYRKAIELDANYGRAYGAIAVTLATDYRWAWTDTPVSTLERALELATRAVELDPASPQTHWALGFVQLTRKDYVSAIAAAEKSIEVAPNYADGYGLVGIISSNQDDPEKAIKYTRRGMELNPYYTWEYLYTLGLSYHLHGNYEKAIEVLEEAHARNGNVVQVKLYLAGCYVRVGRLDDAEWIIEQLQILSPTTLVSTVDKTLSISNNSAKQILLDDLKRAGLPE